MRTAAGMTTDGRRARPARIAAGDGRFDVARVDIGGGWSGRVLLVSRGTDGGAPAAPASDTLAEWRELLTTLVRDPGALPDGVVLKHSRTALVLRAGVRVGARRLEIVCKRSAARGTVGGLVRRVCGSRESRNWKRAFALLNAGIGTALPRAILERSGRSPEAWLITEAIPEALDLDGVMSWHLYDLDARRAWSVKRALSERLVALCARMRDAGIRHRDFKASNVLITDWLGAAEGPRLWLVDLDGLGRHARRGSASQWRSITRLAASLAGASSLTRGDAARFLRGYLATCDGSPADWRRHWRRLAPRVAGYNRRARLRKRGKLDGFE